MFGTYSDYLNRAHAKYEKFSDQDLDPKFIPAYNDRHRIRVKFPDGRVLTGRVGITTGWQPVFLLLKNSRSISSGDLLTRDVIFTTEKVNYRGTL